MRPIEWFVLAGFILLSHAAGALGSLFTTPQIDTWYAALQRPELAPPNWVFAPVWLTLFTLMGIAAFLVWREHWVARREVRVALFLFCVQLALNSLWSIIFFGLHNLGAALVEIVLLWLAIAATMYAFFKRSRAAGLLLVPYLLWVTFAAYLTWQFFILN